MGQAKWPVEGFATAVLFALQSVVFVFASNDRKVLVHTPLSRMRENMEVKVSPLLPRCPSDLSFCFSSKEARRGRAHLSVIGAAGLPAAADEMASSQIGLTMLAAAFATPGLSLLTGGSLFKLGFPLDLFTMGFLLSCSDFSSTAKRVCALLPLFQLPMASLLCSTESTWNNPRHLARSYR